MKCYQNGLMIILMLFVNNQILAESIKESVTPTVYKKGVIWKIESGQKQPSYLMGTMHVSDPGIWMLFKKAQVFFDQSKVVCTEVKLDFETMAAEIQATFFHDGKTLESVIADDKFYQLVVKAAAAKGLAEPAIKNMKPFTLVFMLSMPLPTGRMLDEKIYHDAILAGKKSCALETIEEHANVLNVFSLPDQITMLKGTIEHMDEVENAYPALLKAYLSRDLVAMANLVNESMLLEDARIEEVFLQKFLIDRNKIMVKRMIPHIENGAGFFAVGAMHLTGSAGVLRLLADQGYKLTVIY
ncbi:MAG: TraB/GumN family protein [Gammaproteobacteria bacterium]|nr:TraB/GumN family protein [Gammaproteobacteria bacterium]